MAEFIDSQPWDTGYSRRRQFYGWSYETGELTGVIPEELAALGVRLHDRGLLKAIPDMVLVNEYLPGQGITAHLDRSEHFGDQVAMVSLLDAYPMRFAALHGPAEFEQWLERRSVCVIQGPARYEWTHEIARRKSDSVPGGGKRLRHRRLSVTFRKTL